MYAFWLKGVLLLTAGVGWGDASRVHVGMTQDEAERIVGYAYSDLYVPDSGCERYPNRCQAYYHHTDCLGGVTSLSVLYLGHREPLRVVDCGVEYWPFHDTPPWLEAVRNVLAPAGQ